MLGRIIDKVISRKLFVWGIGTVAYFLNLMTATEWITVSGVYLGVQAMQDTFRKAE